MELSSCFTPIDVRGALVNLPTTLPATYEIILNSVPKRNHRYIRAALQWIACSATPLTLKELAVAAVNDPIEENLHGPENQLMGGGKDIHQMLSRLIDIHRKDPAPLFQKLFPDGTKHSKIKIMDLVKSLDEYEEYRRNPRLDTVHFSHSSVRQYLLQQDNTFSGPGSFCFSEGLAHRFIAKSCLTYARGILDRGTCGGSWSYLIIYLGEHWNKHAARLPNDEPGSLIHLFNEAPFVTWLLLRATDACHSRETLRDVVCSDSEDDPLTQLLSPEQQLQYSACCGFTSVVKGILEKYPHLNVDALSEQEASALALACERGHQETVDIILQHGADPNIGSSSGTPLSLALEHGFYGIARHLIRHNADLHARVGYEGGEPPLAFAIRCCNVSMVEWLLRSGADPNFAEDPYDRPVAVAARHGEHDCMKLLLERGASLETLRTDASSLLAEASRSGSIDTVKSLLECGLPANGQNDLEAYYYDRETSSSKYMLKYPGMDIITGIDKCLADIFGSPMQAAAAFGDTEIIKVLVEYGAAVNVKSHYWETPATLARLRGHQATWEYLLSQGAIDSEQMTVCHNCDNFKESDVYEDRGTIFTYCGMLDSEDDDYSEVSDASSDDIVMEELA